MHKNSELLFRKYALNYFKKHQKIFEIGPLFEPINMPIYLRLIKKICRIEHFNKHDKKSVYNRLIDEKIGKIDYFYGGLNNYGISKPNCIKFNSEYDIDAFDKSFDVVFCGQVLEHVRKPWIWIKELARITKKGGKIILISPISWGYHEDPFDCWRIYPEGIKSLFEEAGIKIEFSKFESLDGKETDVISVGTKL